MEQRGGKPRGKILQTAACFGNRQQIIESVNELLRRLDNPQRIVISANGTSIDRAEIAAIRRCENVRVVSSIYGHIAETFSVSPLVAVAAGLLWGKLPGHFGNDWEGGPIRAASGSEDARDFATICTDISGAVSGMHVAVL
jgi:hypothetical protein